MAKVIAEISFIPIGTGLSLSIYIANALKIIEESGLKYEFHSMGTNIEGEWDDIIKILEKCHKKLFEMGVLRISTNVKFSLRQDKPPSMDSKKEHVEEIAKKLGFDWFQQNEFQEKKFHILDSFINSDFCLSCNAIFL
ncbi:MAG: MTH1187 family thiamine-binding protein [Acidobacteria bacterium]|nr:MTH1187 family thiamine-binding protein [Acidobacteriota bacterium]